MIFNRSPGHELQLMMMEKNLDVRALQEQINLNEFVICEILCERQKITKKIARQLAIVSGLSPEFWTKLQLEFNNDR